MAEQESKNFAFSGEERDKFIEEWNEVCKQLRESGVDLSKIPLVKSYD